MIRYTTPIGLFILEEFEQKNRPSVAVFPLPGWMATARLRATGGRYYTRMCVQDSPRTCDAMLLCRDLSKSERRILGRKGQIPKDAVTRAGHPGTHLVVTRDRHIIGLRKYRKESMSGQGARNMLAAGVELLAGHNRLEVAQKLVASLQLEPNLSPRQVDLIDALMVTMDSIQAIAPQGQMARPMLEAAEEKAA